MASGKFVLRLDPKTHQALKEEARARGESLNSLCSRKLQNPTGSEWSEVCERIVQEFAPEGIILFGSVARGEATQKSDVDLLVVLPKTQQISRALYQRWDQVFAKTEDIYSPQFVHLPHSNEVIGSIWLETALEGEILYEKQRVLRDVLVNIRAQIAEGRYWRKLSHGHSYWVRQEPFDAK